VKIAINLATQPFRRDRPVLVAAAALGGLLLALLGGLISLEFLERGRMHDTRAEIARLEAQMRRLGQEQAKLEAVLRQPENAEVLERSLFLNSLLLRKGISWTRIFDDLERVLPHNVRLISVRPTVNPQNQISLEMNVGAESTQPVIDMLMKLEGSEVFGATQVHSSLPPSQTDPLYRYRVSVNYAQKL
jgi:type IV pilus assembly protein PilN